MKVLSVIAATFVSIVSAHPYERQGNAVEHAPTVLNNAATPVGADFVLPRQDGTPSEESAEDTSLKGSKTDNPPVVTYPPAEKESKVAEVHGPKNENQKQCMKFSPTAGQTWGPCDEDKPNDEVQDFRHYLQDSWCGEVRCKKASDPAATPR
ncbi:hypothetical protein BDV96DRAFT_607254 [Lophiotrema nucula]|uniref:Uncharacterized protein n=1 Tax=Lophiotrema nucula TaxID=690887 RepID=A0A6A5YHX2_9PLEO|nr:hypothetical protein BDV96DRAFT_607254 [Lophiotrema nucula]